MYQHSSAKNWHISLTYSILLQEVDQKCDILRRVSTLTVARWPASTKGHAVATKFDQVSL